MSSEGQSVFEGQIEFSLENAEMNSLCLVLTEVLVDVAEEHHDEADGEEVDGEECRQRPARQPPRVQQLPHRVVVVVMDICGI